MKKKRMHEIKIASQDGGKAYIETSNNAKKPNNEAQKYWLLKDGAW